MQLETKSNQQIKRGALLSYLGIMLGIGITLLFMPWMVSVIGKSNYALYTLANSFVGLFLIDFGLGAAVTRYVAKYRAEDRIDKIEWLLSCVFELYLAIDIVIIVVLFVLFFFLNGIYAGLTQDEIGIYKNIYIIVSIYSVVSFPLLPITGVLGAYERFVEMQIINIAQKLCSVAFGFIGLLIWNDVRCIVIINIIVGIITILAKVCVSRNVLSYKLSIIRFAWKDMSEIAGFSIWSTVLSISNRFTYSMAPTILGVVSNSTEIAVFAPANALESYFYTIAAAINGFFLPKVSRYVANKDRDGLTDLMIRVGRYQSALMGFVFCVFCVVGKDFLRLWMGEDFVGAANCALLLFIPDILLFSEQIASTTVLAENRIRVYSYGHIAMALVSCILMLSFGKQVGALGVAISISVAYMIQFLWGNYIYCRYLPIDMKRFYRECYLKLLLPIGLYSLVSFYLFSKVVLPNIWLDFIIKMIIEATVYIIVLLILLDAEEKEYLKAVLHNRKG